MDRGGRDVQGTYVKRTTVKEPELPQWNNELFPCLSAVNVSTNMNDDNTMYINDVACSFAFTSSMKNCTHFVEILS